MLDRRLIIEQPDLVRTALNKRNADEDTLAALERIIDMDAQRKAVNTETDDLRAKRNALSKQINFVETQNHIGIFEISVKGISNTIS